MPNPDVTMQSKVINSSSISSRIRAHMQQKTLPMVVILSTPLATPSLRRRLLMSYSTTTVWQGKLIGVGGWGTGHHAPPAPINGLGSILLLMSALAMPTNAVR